MSKQTAVVFGATGAIGSAICDWFNIHNYSVIAISRKKVEDISNHTDRLSLNWDGNADIDILSTIKEQSINAVVWAQGANLNDNIYSFDLTQHEAIYQANVTYILLSLQALLKNKSLAPSARLCVISSIWQNIARQNKLSYCITKSALQGLIQSISIDLGADGYLINAVLPGATDTPMTRANLKIEQITTLEKATPLNSLPTLDDISNLVGFLCSQNNTGITGQFIAADRGFSNARII